MNFSEALRTFLLDNDTLSDNFGVRVFNYRVEQSYVNQFPACVFDINLPLPSNVVEDDTSLAGLYTTNFSIFIATQDPDLTMYLASIIRDLLHEYNGTMGDDTVLRMLVQNHLKIYELEPEIFMSQLDFEMYTSTKPQFNLT